MSFIAPLPRQTLPRRFHQTRPRREKIYGNPRGNPLDGNAKARIFAYADAYNAKHKKKGQHVGPLTRLTLKVLEVLLKHFHNSRSGLCFPGEETIAAHAKLRCHPDTVAERRPLKPPRS